MHQSRVDCLVARRLRVVAWQLFGFGSPADVNRAIAEHRLTMADFDDLIDYCRHEPTLRWVASYVYREEIAAAHARTEDEQMRRAAMLNYLKLKDSVRRQREAKANAR